MEKETFCSVYKHSTLLLSRHFISSPSTCVTAMHSYVNIFSIWYLCPFHRMMAHSVPSHLIKSCAGHGQKLIRQHPSHACLIFTVLNMMPHVSKFSDFSWKIMLYACLFILLLVINSYCYQISVPKVFISLDNIYG